MMIIWLDASQRQTNKYVKSEQLVFIIDIR